MKSIGVLLLLTLLTPLAATAKMCEADKLNTGTVRIDVDPTTGKATPDTCKVQAGTTIHWKSDKAFETKFTEPPNEGSTETTFKSEKKPWWFHHEATITATTVDSEKTFKYDVTAGGTKIDPTIIVDPKPPTKVTSSSAKGK
jgi:plastocyanin